MSCWCIVLPLDGAARSVAEEAVAAFGECSINHSVFDCQRIISGLRSRMKQNDDTFVVDVCNHMLIVQCLDRSVTHLLVGGLAPVTLFSLGLCRRYSVTTVQWFYEDYKTVSSWKNIIEGYDCFAAIQHGPLEAACRDIGNTYCFLPPAASRAALKQPDIERIYDICFVGLPGPDRISVLEQLARDGLKIAIAGHGWNTYRGILDNAIIARTWISSSDAAALYAASHIGLDMPGELPADTIDAQVGPRVYDILACGSHLLALARPLLSESLSGCEYYTFSLPQQASEKAREILDNKAALFKQSRRNRQQVRARHTYSNRVKALMEYVTL